jgi:hypothetical protein
VAQWEAFDIKGKVQAIINYLCALNPTVCVNVAVSSGLPIPDGVVNTPYSATIVFSGTAPFAINSIIKPAWMSIILNGSNVNITGTPPTAGTNIPVSFNVTNCSTGNVNISETIDVTAAPPPAPGATTTSLASSINPSTVGQNVTFNATVNSNGAVTGNVTFYNGATILGTVALSGNTATFSTAALAQGSHNITARYNGDANYAASTSPVLVQTVNASAPPSQFTAYWGWKDDNSTLTAAQIRDTTNPNNRSALFNNGAFVVADYRENTLDKYLWVAIQEDQAIPTSFNDGTDEYPIGPTGAFKSFVNVPEPSGIALGFHFSISNYPTSNTQNSITFKY